LHKDFLQKNSLHDTASCFTLVDIATVKWFVRVIGVVFSGCEAQGFVDLELQDMSYEVPAVLNL
jgi:hypothetical protein